MVVKSVKTGAFELDSAKLFDGTCTTTVPSCSAVGRATVVVVATDPEYTEVTVVYRAEFAVPLLDAENAVSVRPDAVGL